MKQQQTLFTLALLFSSAILRAQSTPEPVLQRLAKQSADYRKSLPSFTCEESVVSIAKQKKKILRRAEFHANIRVIRRANGTLTEDFNITTINGRANEDVNRFPIPFNVQGGLSRAFPAFFVAEKQPCYIFTVASTRIDFAWQTSAPPCDEVPSTRGFVLIDNTGNILHAETHRDPIEAHDHGFTALTTVDYAPVTLNGTPYRLPTHLYAETQDGDFVGTFDAHYTNCKLFHATITLGPAGTSPIQDPK